MTGTLTAVEHGLWINGAWTTPVHGESFSVEDPGSGEVIGRVASASAEDVARAITVADAAGADWKDTSPKRRSELLLAAYQAMVQERDVIAELIVAESGKTLADAHAEVQYAADFFGVYGRLGYTVEGQFARSGDGTRHMLVTHAPVGLAALVTPWNFPAAMVTRKVAPALAAGCPVIIKPASATPLTALYLAELLGRVGIPAGLVNVLPAASSREVVGHLLNDRTVRKLSFTGSTEVGKQLLGQAAQRVVNCSMELGGNAPFLVLQDADLEAAVDGALQAKMRNGGQSCIGANRFYVHEDLVLEFTRRLSERMSALRIGHGMTPGVEVGPLISAKARADLNDVVQGAVTRGANLVSGGRQPDLPGWFYEPTVLGDVAADDEILHTELFGPVAPIVAFREEAEAILLANDTEFGLAGYVYSGSLDHALEVGEALEVGVVGLNRGLVSDASAPFGGVKASGLGREGGPHGLAEYLEPKYLSFSST